MFQKGLSLSIAPLLALLGAAQSISAQEVVQAGKAPVDQFHPANAAADDGSVPRAPEPVYGACNKGDFACDQLRFHFDIRPR